MTIRDFGDYYSQSASGWRRSENAECGVVGIYDGEKGKDCVISEYLRSGFHYGAGNVFLMPGGPRALGSTVKSGMGGKMKKPILFVLAIAFVANAYAGSQAGQVKWFRVRQSDNLHYLMLEGAKADSPACATQSYWIIKDENSVAAKTQVSMIIAAYMAGKAITIQGANTCTRWGDGEDINIVTFE